MDTSDEKIDTGEGAQAISASLARKQRSVVVVSVRAELPVTMIVGAEEQNAHSENPKLTHKDRVQRTPMDKL